MVAFDPEQFEDKYVHYFEELEAAYSAAYQQLHGQRDSEILRAIDRQILSESEPVYEGDGAFHIALPDDVEDRIHALPGDEERVVAVLEEFTDHIERELRRTFEFED